jgi:hypothetical protein
VKQLIRALFLLLDLSKVGSFLIAESLSFQTGSDACLKQDRIKWLGNVIACTHLNAFHYVVELIRCRENNQRNIAQERVGF